MGSIFSGMRQCHHASAEIRFSPQVADFCARHVDIDAKRRVAPIYLVTMPLCSAFYILNFIASGFKNIFYVVRIFANKSNVSFISVFP
ncbi:hypothetical protein CFR77_10020 [Komagataeibacter sucrofermentans]|uniref:Uncharacterized protein n=1 Tax=Komagataeibacter sucrofermentans TaxID=1053551 RepID=A0A318QJL0_9PROT|nr:hypothetical protein CFR77_10020 [Komagataeibacter sucrofermentans]